MWEYGRLSESEKMMETQKKVKIVQIMVTVSALLLIAGCSGSKTTIKDNRLNLELRTEDNQGITDNVQIIMVKGSQRQFFQVGGMNYTIDRMYEPPYDLIVSYRPELYDTAKVVIEASDFNSENLTGTKKIIIPVQKTRFFGSVMDDKGRPILGATVTIEDVGQNITNDKGFWEVFTYRVSEGNIVTISVAKKNSNSQDLYKSFSRTSESPVVYHGDNNMGTYNLQALELVNTTTDTSESSIEDSGHNVPIFGR